MQFTDVTFEVGTVVSAVWAVRAGEGSFPGVDPNVGQQVELFLESFLAEETPPLPYLRCSCWLAVVGGGDGGV